MLGVGSSYMAFIMLMYVPSVGFTGGTVVKNLPANARDAGLIPVSGRSTGIGNGKPLQYSCLENSMDRETWWATVHEVLELDTTE